MGKSKRLLIVIAMLGLTIGACTNTDQAEDEIYIDAPDGEETEPKDSKN